jgi:recombination protein RecA
VINDEARKVLAQLNKKFGDGVVVLASDIRSDIIPRITSGSTTLDYVLGGGFPGNQWNELVGEPSHGKTALALKTIAANQKLNPDYTTVWVAAEQWVPEYAAMCGVDMERIIVIETSIMEEAYQAVIQFAESKSVDAIVIDSLPALSPMPEMEKDMSEATVGRGALLTNKFFRVVGTAMKRSLTEDERPVLGLIINQYRMKIGVMHGDPRTTPGGEGKNYAFFTRCEVRRDEWIEIGPSGNKNRIGQRIKVRTLKNKTAPPQRVAYFDFYFAEGGNCAPGEYDFAKEIASLAVVMGYIERRGGWFYYGERKWQGIESVIASIREEIDFMQDLQKKVLENHDTPAALIEEEE